MSSSYKAKVSNGIRKYRRTCTCDDVTVRVVVGFHQRNETEQGSGVHGKGAQVLRQKLGESNTIDRVVIQPPSATLQKLTWSLLTCTDPTSSQSIENLFWFSCAFLTRTKMENFNWVKWPSMSDPVYTLTINQELAPPPLSSGSIHNGGTLSRILYST